MTSARVVIFGLVAAVLAGGVVGVLLGGVVAGPGAGFGAGTASAAVAAALVGFLVALLILRPRASAVAQAAPSESDVRRQPELSEPPADAPAVGISTDGQTPAAGIAGSGQPLEHPGTDDPGVPVAAPAAPEAQSAPAVRAPEPVREPQPAAEATSAGVLVPGAILLRGLASDRDAALDEVGRLLVETGAVEAPYIESMRVRENSVSTYMGSQLAIPHGTTAGKTLIRRSAVAVVRYPESITWHGNPVRYVVAIAGAGDDHLKLVSKVAEVFLDSEAVAALENAQSPSDVLRVFSGLNAGR